MNNEPVGLIDFIPLLREGTLTTAHQQRLADLLAHLLDLLRQKARVEWELSDLRQQSATLLANFQAQAKKS